MNIHPPPKKHKKNKQCVNQAASLSTYRRRRNVEDLKPGSFSTFVNQRRVENSPVTPKNLERTVEDISLKRT